MPLPQKHLELRVFQGREWEEEAWRAPVPGIIFGTQRSPEGLGCPVLCPRFLDDKETG